MTSELDFRFIERRKPKTLDGPCLHNEHHSIYPSSTYGDIPVCQLGDHHLVNAVKKLEKMRGKAYEIGGLREKAWRSCYFAVINEMNFRGLTRNFTGRRAK